MERIRSGVPATVHRQPIASIGNSSVGSLLDQIRGRTRLRVGYRPDNPPYSYFNASDELVGFDVEMAHQLARELGVDLEFVPVPFDTFVRASATGAATW